MEEMINMRYILDAQGARLERSNKRLFILCVVLLIVLLATNGGWLFYESQFSDETTTMIEAEQDGDVNVIGGGDVTYGSESKGNENH